MWPETLKLEQVQDNGQASFILMGQNSCQNRSLSAWKSSCTEHSLMALSFAKVAQRDARKSEVKHRASVLCESLACTAEERLLAVYATDLLFAAAKPRVPEAPGASWLLL